jgi:DNA (cytosine-5)-methyltransferase 1
MLTAVDLFAGGGGGTCGAKLAGVNVLLAANHWQAAIDCHSVNHPEVKHLCQDLRQADWFKFPDHDILIGSPSCQGHSKARGKERRHHDASRATAWAMVDCVEVKQPSYLVVENVPEFLKWRHYQRWNACLAEDYRLTENILDAADLAIPQHRKRLFIVGVHKKVSKFPITINKPSLPHQPASSIIDWKASGWSKVHRFDRAAKTIQRVKEGRREFGDKPFLMAYYGNARGGRSLDRPIGSVTTHDRYALIFGKWMRMLTAWEYKLAMGFHPDYILPEQHTTAVKLVGNAVCPPVMRYLLHQIKKSMPLDKLRTGGKG